MEHAVVGDVSVEAEKGKAYLYYFTKVPPANGNQPSRGATTRLEIPYALGNGLRTWTDGDRALSETMTSYWVNFAASGSPNGKGLPVWPEFKGANGKSMILGEKVEAGEPWMPSGSRSTTSPSAG